MDKQPTITTQRTSKRIKLIMAVSVCLMISGCPWVLMAGAEEGTSAIGAGVFMVGMLGYAGARVARWWYHE